MPDPAATTKPARRGRPATGQALSSTERSRRRREQLARLGRRPVSVTLGPAAAAALDRLCAGGLTVEQAVEQALERAGG